MRSYNACTMVFKLGLREGHTIVGVMDTKKAMRFYIGNDVMDEKTYE